MSPLAFPIKPIERRSAVAIYRKRRPFVKFGPLLASVDPTAHVPGRKDLARWFLQLDDASPEEVAQFFEAFGVPSFDARQLRQGSVVAVSEVREWVADMAVRLRAKTIADLERTTEGHLDLDPRAGPAVVNLRQAVRWSLIAEQAAGRIQYCEAFRVRSDEKCAKPFVRLRSDERFHSRRCAAREMKRRRDEDARKRRDGATRSQRGDDLPAEGRDVGGRPARRVRRRDAEAAVPVREDEG